MKTYLVTGGAGFLGCTLVRKLLKQGERVIVYDNFSFGRRENIDIDNKNLCIIEGDMVDKDHLGKVVSKHKPRIVIHLAALHFIPYCNKYTCETLRVNVEGTQNLLNVCKDSSVKKILAASSAAVYPPNDAANVETDAVGYFDIYGTSKVFMENLINAHAKETSLPCANLRFFNIYGPYETNPHLIPRIMDQFVSGAKVIELGNLSPLRDYIFVEDMADGIISLAEARLNGSDVFNIGTGLEYSVTEIVERLNKITGRDVKIKSVEKYRRLVDREHLLSDISKIKSATGWQPRHSIDEGLRKTAEFYNLI